MGKLSSSIVESQAFYSGVHLSPAVICRLGRHSISFELRGAVNWLGLTPESLSVEHPGSHFCSTSVMTLRPIYIGMIDTVNVSLCTLETACFYLQRYSRVGVRHCRLRGVHYNKCQFIDCSMVPVLSSFSKCHMVDMHPLAFTLKRLPCLHVPGSSDSHKEQCRRGCPQGTFEDAGKRLCLGCPAPCVDCWSGGLCLTCLAGHFLNRKAVINTRHQQAPTLPSWAGRPS